MESDESDLFESLIRLHILGHAEAGAHGEDVVTALRGLGYDIGLGTVRRMFQEMEADGFLQSGEAVPGKPRWPRIYRLTARGEKVLREGRRRARGFLDVTAG